MLKPASAGLPSEAHMITRPITQPLTKPAARGIPAQSQGGRKPKPGDYLTDENGNYLTDELGNRLTA